MRDLETWHFWFAGRRLLVERWLGRHVAPGAHVLDVGCGTGAMLSVLVARGYRAAGVDLRPEGLVALRREVPYAMLIRADATAVPVADGTADAVLLLDLLEHTEDRTALVEARRVLRPGGVAIITVPAFPWLWSYRDEAAGHRRRYAPREVLNMVTAAGLTVQTAQFYQCLLFPLVVATRLLGRRGPRLRNLEEQPPRALNAVLTRMARLDARLGEIIPWPWGSTLAVLCRKL